MLYQLNFSKVLEKVIKNSRVFSKILKREIFYNIKTRKSIAFRYIYYSTLVAELLWQEEEICLVKPFETLERS